MRITKKIISLLLVISMLASFFAMTGFEASAALTGQQKTDFGLHFDNTTRKFKVLQLSDIQTDHGDSNIALSTKETIRMAIEQYDPDLILLSGDQVQGGSGLLATLAQWKSSINAVFNTFTPYMSSDCKVVAVPGNHEYDFDNLKDQWEYYNAQSWYLDWDNNFSTVDLNGEPGAGNVTISASSGDNAVALNIALFNSKGDDEDGYLRPGGDDDAAYQQIVDWYTNMNNTLASSAYSYKAKVTGQASAYVPAFGMQHVILQEIYNSMVSCGPTDGGVAAATDGNYSSLLNASYMKFRDGLTYTGVLGEAPCPSTLGAGATTALYNALLAPGNFLGMCFGHDHLNTFDITDANGFRFLMGGALTTENYNNGNPNVRYMEFTLDDATGNVDLRSETKSFNDYTSSAVTDVTSDRIEAIDGNGVQLINTFSTPKTIYIGSTENNNDPRAIQKKGNNVQPRLLDYVSKQYYDQDLSVSFCVPANAQISSYGAWAGNGGGTQLTLETVGNETTSEGVRYDFKIATSNTLTDGDTILYKVVYTVDGKPYEIYSSSTVENIKMPAGYTDWFRSWRRSNDSSNYCDLHYVSTLSGSNAYSFGRDTDTTGDLTSNTHYNYSSPGTDVDLMWVNHHGDSFYSMYFWSPARVEETSLISRRNIYFSPQTDIYLDASALQPVAAGDSRLDTGVRIDFWMPMNQGRGFTHYAAGIGFYAGDQDFVWNGTTIDPNDAYATYDDAVNAEENSMSSGTADDATVFVYDSYAGQQKYAGLGTTHVNHNNDDDNKIGNLSGQTKGYPLVVDSEAAALALNNVGMTMFTGVRVRGADSNGARQLNYAIAPFYLIFHTFDKGELRELTMGEFMNPRSRTDYPNATDLQWDAYISAYKNAVACYAQTKTTQTDIDKYHQTLNDAIVALLNSNKGKPDESNLLKGTSQFGSIAVPPIIYVPFVYDSEYKNVVATPSQIQTAAPYTDRAITYTVPAGATNVSCIVVNAGSDTVNSAVTTSTTNNGTSYTTTITGGTATAGGAIYYKLSYTLPEDKNGDGKNDTYTQYAASYVKGVPMTEGMWIHQTYRQRAVIDYDTSIYIKNTLTMDNNILSSRGVSGIISLYGGVQGTSFHTTVVNGTTNEYTRYGSEGVYWAVGTAHQWPSSSGYGAANRVLFFNDRSRAKFNSGDAYWNGLKNYSTDATLNTGGNNSDEYVVANIYFDPQATGAQSVKPRFKLVTTTSSNNCNTPTVYKYWDASNYTAVNYSGDYVSKSPDVATSGMFTLASTGANNNWANGNSMTLEDGAVWETYIDANNTLSNFTATATYSRLIIHAEKKNSVWNNSIMGFAFVFNRVDRSNAHQAIKWATGQEIVSPSALFNEDDMDPAWWSQWRNEIMEAYIACGNLWGSDFDTSLVISLWQNPIYKEADYSALNDLINDITSAGLVTGTNEHISSYTTFKYKVNVGDDSRYVGQSYDRLMFVNNAADLITTLKNRTSVYGDVDKNGQTASDANGNLHNAHLDIRYQGYIDDYVTAIQQAWDKLRLQNADYTAFDKFTNYYNSTDDTILFMRDDYAGFNNDSDARDYANEKNLQSAMFTADTRKAFIDSLNIDRTLKKPSETMVVGSLPRIYPAAYTYKNVSSPDTTDCYYNTARDAYEGLQFRRAGEYYSADGTYTEDGVTYYANYNKQDRGNGYYYTPVFTASYNSLTADITNGGYAVTDAKVGPTYNAGNTSNVPVTDGAGNVTNYVSMYTETSWGGNRDPYGFADAYVDNLSDSNSTYKTTNSSDKWVLALYVDSQICPQLASVDYYYDKLKANVADLTQLNIQKNSYAEYEEGGSGYDALAGYTILDENGNALTGGAQWYTADTWNEYISVKQADGTSIPDGASLAEAQDIINTITQTIYQKRNALQLRPMEDYRVSDSLLGAVTSDSDIVDMSQYDASKPEQELPVLIPAGTTYPAANDFTSINNIIAYYNAVIGNKYVGVFGSRYTVPQDRTVVEGNSLLFKKHYYYNEQFRTNIAARYFAIDGYAGKPMATNIQNYVTAVNEFKDLFDQSGQNLNAADYSTITMLLNKAWIPTYDTYGTGSYVNGTFVLGDNTTGADWYTPESWAEYFNARETAAKLYESNNGYDGYLGFTQAYGNGEAVGDLLVDSQGSNATNVDGSVNKVAYDLLVAYYKLQYKKVSDFEGTIAGLTGTYYSINEQLDAMLLAKEQETVDVVVLNAAGELETVKKSVYDPQQIALARAFKDNILALANEDLGPMYNDYLTAVNNYKTTIENLPQAPVYLDGWNGIIAHLNENAGDTVTIADSGTLTSYFNAVYTGFNPAQVYATDGMSINNIFSNKAMYDGFGLTAKQGQAQYNTLIANFYNELKAASFTPAQVTRAADDATAKLNDSTKVAYDPLQLGGRDKVLETSKFTADSVTAAKAVINATKANKVTLWDTKTAVTGYNDNAGTVVDGTLADEIWAAVGLISETETKDYDGADRDERYVLVEGGQFLEALNDALEYAKGELYDENGEIKTFEVLMGDGTPVDPNPQLFTDDSVQELLAAIEAGEAVDDTTVQADIDQIVFNILEQTDIDNKIALKTSAGDFYGELTSVAEDDGLKYVEADYTYFSEELAKALKAKSDGAQALIDQVWIDNGDGTFALDNSNGSKYFTPDTWTPYYTTYLDALKANRSLTAKDQDTINGFTTEVYNTREALAWNGIDESTQTTIDSIGSRIDSLSTEFVTVNTYKNSVVSVLEDGKRVLTAPEMGYVELSPYGDVSYITSLWESFKANYIESGEELDITKQQEMLDSLVEIQDLLANLETKKFDVDESNEFTIGVRNLVDTFIAGSYTYNGIGSSEGVGTYTADYLATKAGTEISAREKNIRDQQQIFIQNKLNAIYTILGSNFEVGDVYIDYSTGVAVRYETALDAVNTLTEELYNYVTGTCAQYAGFALDMRQDMYDYFNTTIDVCVDSKRSAADPYVYYKEVRIFPVESVDSAMTTISKAFSIEENWPTISQLDSSVGISKQITETINPNDTEYEILDKDGNSTDAYTSAINILKEVGAYSKHYTNLLASANAHTLAHVEWLAYEAVLEKRGTIYILADPGESPVIDGATFAYSMDKDVNRDGDWYTTDYGESVGDSKYYVAASKNAVTGSSNGGWFTDASYNILTTQLNIANTEIANYTGDDGGYKLYGASGTKADAAYQKFEEINRVGKCWSAENRAAFIAAVEADQAAIDTVAKDVYEAIIGLQLLPATDAYREVAGLIYEALGLIPTYSIDNTVDAIIEDDSVGSLAPDSKGGRIFNLDLLEEIDEDDKTTVTVNGETKYYAINLPAKYSGGTEAVEAILDVLADEMDLNTVTIDKQIEVLDYETNNITSVKEKIMALLEGLELSLANLGLITSLTAAFLYNNPLNEESLGSYDLNSDFFYLHDDQGVLGKEGKAYEYKNDPLMMMAGDAYHASGFYDFTKYTDASLADVIDYLNNNDIIKSTTAADAKTYNVTEKTGFDIVFTEAIGDELYKTPATMQQKIDEIYAGLVSVINNLELRAADTVALKAEIEEAEEIKLNKDLYDYESDEGKAAWNEFIEASQVASSYENATVINEKQVEEAENELSRAIKALKLNVDSYAPVVTIHNTQSDLTKFHDAHKELKAIISDSDDMVAPSYMEPGLGGYTLYVYTNQINPHIVVSLKDATVAANGDGSTREVKASKPEKMTVTAQAMSGVTASVITPVFDANGVAESAQKVAIAGATVDATSASTQTAKTLVKDAEGNETYNYAAGSSAYIVLNPSFEGVKDGDQSAVAYSINATDSAVEKVANGEDDFNIVPKENSASSLGYTTGSIAAEEITGNITVFVYYMNSMPEDGNDSGVVDGTVNASAVLTTNEKNGLKADKWTNHAMLYRTFAKPVRSWEFSETSAQLEKKGAAYYDPTFGENNFGSFAYVLDPNAESGSFDYEVAEAYFAENGGEAAAKAKAIELLKSDNDYITQFNGYVEKGSTAIGQYGYKHYGAHDINGQYENWEKPMGNIDNGTLVFIHVADRFGNVCNRIIEWKNYDPYYPVLSTEEAGKVSVTEPGGSGVAKVDLFKDMGTFDDSLYIGDLYDMLHIEGATYATEGNTFTISAGAENANKHFTVAVTDNAGNVKSIPVNTDANGDIVITVTQTFDNVANYKAKPISNVATESGEDLSVIEFVFNGESTVLLNYSEPTSIVKAGPDGNVFANKKNVPLNIITKAEVESVKLYNVATGTEEIWTAENATVKDNGDGTETWTVKYTFAEGEHNYKATAMVEGKWEASSVDFDFTATTKKVSIVTSPIGAGRTELSFNNGSVRMASAYDKVEVPYGSVVKIKATSINESSDFFYWENGYTRRIISTADTTEFIAVANMNLTAQFTTTELITNDKKLVVYVNNAENVVDSYELADGDDYKVPAAPSLAEHVFKSWSMTKDEVLASAEKLIVVRPIYSLVVKNTVTLTEGNWTATGAGEYETVGDERPVVTVSASAADEAGAGFLYWLDAETGEIASYNRTYTFYVIKDTELTPVYGDASAVMPVPVARIATVKYDDKADKVSFFAERSVPAGYTMIQTGIVVTKSESVASNEDAFILDASGVSKGTSKSLSASGYYSASVSATSGVTAYARAYVIYANADGDIIHYYSPVSSYTA